MISITAGALVATRFHDDGLIIAYVASVVAGLGASEDPGKQAMAELVKAGKVVPAGNVELATVKSKLSVPLPVLVTRLVKTTVPPCVAVFTVEPPIVTPVACVTVKLTVAV